MISGDDWAASFQGCWQADYQWMHRGCSLLSQHKGSGIVSLIAVVSGQFAVLLGSPHPFSLCDDSADSKHSQLLGLCAVSMHLILACFFSVQVIDSLVPRPPPFLFFGLRSV